MFSQFISIGVLMLLAVMTPGPDFAIVTKNTLFYSRRIGIFTSLGIASAVLFHISYCILGLALVISQSLLLFSLIKYIGAAYLIYLGCQALLTKEASVKTEAGTVAKRQPISAFTAYRQGVICNLFNPKATLFFLAIFTMVIHPNMSHFYQLLLAAEMVTIVLAWFCTLTWIISHPKVRQLLNKAEIIIVKVLGVFLVGFGVSLVFLRR